MYIYKCVYCRLDVVKSPVQRDEVCRPTSLPDGRQVFRCIYCHKDFCSFSDINRHMDFHEGTHNNTFYFISLKILNE